MVLLPSSKCCSNPSSLLHSVCTLCGGDVQGYTYKGKTHVFKVVPGEFGSRLNDPRNSCYNSGCLATDLAARPPLRRHESPLPCAPLLEQSHAGDHRVGPQLSSAIDLRL